MKPMPIAGTETMFCKDIIDATETSEPSVTARSECNYSGVCKSEQEGKKLIETGEKNPCIWAYVLIENNKKLFSLER